MSRIDVIIPCYNYGRYLSECVRSVLSQEGSDVRVLIIDDCSRDDSLALARRIAAGEPRIEVRAHAVNQGHIATYNEGIDWVSAPFMLLLSADDLAAPGAFPRAISLMEAHPGIAFVHGTSPAFHDRQDLPCAPSAGPHRAHVQAGMDFIRAICRRPANPVETATAIVRTSCQRRVGGYRPSLPHAGDMEMWLRLAAVGDVGVIEGVQAYTRLHGTNMRLNYSRGLVPEDFRQRMAVFSSFFAEHAASIPDAAPLEATARRQLAIEVLRTAGHALRIDPATDLSPAFALVRELVPGAQRRLLTGAFRTLWLARRMAGTRLWNAARQTRDVLQGRSAR